MQACVVLSIESPHASIVHHPIAVLCAFVRACVRECDCVHVWVDGWVDG